MDHRYQQALGQAFEQGRKQGYQEGAAGQRQEYDLGFQQMAEELRREFDQKMNRSAGGMRKMLDEKNAYVDQKLSELSEISKALLVERSGGPVSIGYQRDEGNIVRPGMIRIEDIPGRRVPYVLMLEIQIENNTTSIRESSVTISQDGPFVAVKRMAIFQSAHEFRVTDPETGLAATFAGRSNGRFRPIHSAADFMDSQHNAIADTATWWLSFFSNPGIVAGTELPSGVLGLPSNMSSFRTMEFDGRVEMINAGSSYPRQNRPIPSAWWTSFVNSPWELGALDFFERGEVITVRVLPTHVNNPPAGNVDGACVFPVTGNGGTGFPFLDGQYDSHEGICTPDALTLGTTDPLLPNVIAVDPVVRLPDGIFVVGFEGYRIIQPVGPAP